MRGDSETDDESLFQLAELKQGARYDLFRGKLDRAIERLDEALFRAGSDPETLNDSAVGYWERGTRTDRPLDLLTALERIRKARVVDPDSTAIQFNHALIQQGLGMRSSAAISWRSFLEEEPSGGWAGEARGHLQLAIDESRRLDWQRHRLDLERGDPLSDDDLRLGVTTYPRQLFELTEERLLGRLTEPGNQETAKARVGRIGRALAEARGEWMILDALESLERASADRRLQLAASHHDFAEGMRLYRSVGCGQAAPLLRRAEAGLREGGSPIALDARYYGAVCDYYGLAEKGRREFEALAAHASIERYPNLRGRVYWMLGTASLVSGQFEAAIHCAEEMRKSWRRAAGDDQAAMADTQLASAYDARGQIERGWRHRLQGLLHLLPYDTPRRRHSLLHEAAQALARYGRNEAALAFLDEVLLNSRVWKDSLAAAEGHTLRSRALASIGDIPGSLADAEAALHHASRMPRGDLRERTIGAALLSRGFAEIAEQPRAALASLESGYLREKETGWNYERLLYLYWTAQAQIRLGSLDEARKTLLASVQEYESMRAQAFDSNARGEVFQIAQRSFDALLGITPVSSRQGAFTALSYAERARARGLLDSWSANESLQADVVRPLRAEEIVQRLPANLVLLELAVLPDKVVYWVVERGNVRAGELPIRTEELERFISDFRSALQNRQARRTRRLASELYDILLRPLALDLSEDKTLVLVPDSSLARLPFIALFDRESHQYLIERSPVTTVPSASLAVILAERRQGPTAPTGRPLRALVVGAPDLFGTEFRNLAQLPGAEAEARKVAGLYADATLLLGNEAQRGRFLAEIPRHSLVHFAGHSVSIGLGDANILLLLTPDEPNSPTGVSIADLRKLHLRGVTTVVLAACSALDGPSQGREGALSVAGAFLQAGVPSVVAPLWAVRDAEAANFMLRLHRHLRTGLRAPEAVQATVHELRKATDRKLDAPEVWAPYSSLGI